MVKKVIQISNNIQTIIANNIKANYHLDLSNYVANELKCVYFNARSIVNKIDELQLLIEAEHPDVIGISETWLKDNILNNELIVNDYNIYKHDKLNKIGGGVLLLVRKGIKTIIRKNLTNKFNEIVWRDLITINRKLIMVAVTVVLVLQLKMIIICIIL